MAVKLSYMNAHVSLDTKRSFTIDELDWNAKLHKEGAQIRIRSSFHLGSQAT